MPETTRVHFGAFAPPVSEQLGTSKDYDADFHALTRLYIIGVLSDAETQRARKRLLKLALKAAGKATQPPKGEE